MRNMGVDMVGTNCGAGPEQFLGIVKTVYACSGAPVLAQPNAGLPVLEEGRTVFKLGPEDFAEQAARLVEAGTSCLGGCCGTTPDHIRALASAVSGLTPPSPAPRPRGQIVLTSRTSLVRLGRELPVRIIGERVNPTGKKQLTEELQAGKLTLAQDLAVEQEAQGARILDVNVGAPLVDETALLPELVLSLCSRVRTPLCLDTADPVALEQSLPAYPASPLVNSISGEPGRLEKLGPLCAKYGAPFILLPLEGGSLPVTAAQRIRIIEDLLARMQELDIPRSLAMVDALVLTVSSKADAALHCLETIRYCRETLELPTVAGLSNISFGLPARELINSTFLPMASAVGLSACIANPGSTRLREALASSQVLLGRDPQAQSFIADFSGWKSAGTDPRRPGRRQNPLPNQGRNPGSRGAVRRQGPHPLPGGRGPGQRGIPGGNCGQEAHPRHHRSGGALRAQRVFPAPADPVRRDHATGLRPIETPVGESFRGTRKKTSGGHGHGRGGHPRHRQEHCLPHAAQPRLRGGGPGQGRPGLPYRGGSRQEGGPSLSASRPS